MMYQSLAFHDEGSNSMPIFSVDGLRESKVEAFQGHKTSKRTLLVCSMILIATTGLLATWIFVSKPRFIPKLGIFARTNTETGDSYEMLGSKLSVKPRQRRDVAIPKIKPKANFKVETINNPIQFLTNDSRLPFNLIPEDYYLQLKIDLSESGFIGYAKMMLTCERKTNQIIFHGRHLVLNNITIILEKEVIHYLRIVYIRKFEFFIIQLEGDMEEGKLYEIHVNYTSTYGNSLAGFYKSNYTNNGEQRYIMCRSSQRRCSVKKGVPRNNANFTGKHLYWSLFLTKRGPATFLKRESNTGVFL